jgi:hypothetical protein
MAGGMLTKQATLNSAKFLNDVNDAVQGGVVVSVPSGAPSPSVSQDLIGDRITLDDATALALSDTAIGTLFGGVYEYVQVKTTTRIPARGGIAFFKTADLGTASNAGYIVYGDPDPTAAVPTHVAGIFINVVTPNNFGWIQVAGAASVQFDDAALSSAVDGNMVSVKISSANAATKTYPADSGATVSQITVAALLGVACGLPSSTVISTVMLTRGLFMGRI